MSMSVKVTPHAFMGDGPTCKTCQLSGGSRVHSQEARAEFARNPKLYEFQAAGRTPAASEQAAKTLKTDPTPADRPEAEYGHRPELAVERAFLSTVGGRMLLTSRAMVVTDADQLPREMASQFTKSGGNKHFLWLQGNYVEADRPNGNGAFWTSGDLEMGEPTVQFGPVNMLHQERHIIGTIADAHLYRETATENAHIVSQAAIWRFLYPGEARAIERASDAGTLWQSMECEAESIICQSSQDGARQGCGREYAWQDYRAYLLGAGGSSICSHIRERSSQRRFVKPSFLGTAIVLPPARPAWGAAEAEVLKETASQIEQMAVRPNLPDEELESLIAQVVAYGKGL